MWTVGVALVSLLVDQAILASIKEPNTNDLKTHDLQSNLARVVRNSENPFIEYSDIDDYDDHENKNDDYPVINQPPLHEGPERFLNYAPEPRNHENFEESSTENAGPEFRFDRTFIDEPGLPLGCQRPSDQPNDSNLGMPPFQMYPPNQSPILIPMPYGYPPMPILPQGNSYPGYPLQQLPMHAGYGSQMIFLGEPNQNTQKNIPVYYTTPSLQEFSNSSSAIDPRLVALSHGHSHIFPHTHTRNHKSPVLNILPDPPIERPNINLHVIQNQNSAISPQHAHMAPLPTGFHAHGEQYMHGQVPRPPMFSGGGVPIREVVGPAAATAGPFGNHQLIAPHAGGSTMHQSQGFFQGTRAFPGVVGVNQKDLQLDPPTEENNEKLGTFPMEDLPMNPLPTLPQNLFDLTPEEQRYAMEDYFTKEQRNIRDYLDRIDENNRRNMELLSKMIHVENNPSRIENMNFDQSLLSENTKYLDNEMEEMMPSELESVTNSNLGHIINVPYKYDSESDWLMRFSRSLNKTSAKGLDKLLLIERELIDQLKKDAKHDEDLMMIGYIGDNMITNLEKKKNETKRTKRDIEGTNHKLPLKSLFVDPKMNLDVPKTLDNFGAVAKDTFEHERTPMYHVRNIMGSAQDAVLATIKIPTKNFLIPSQYEIVSTGRDAEEDINPNYLQGQNPQQIPDTFQRVGSAIRSSVLSGQEAIGHVGEVANHAKNAIHSTRYIAPRFMSHRIPLVTKRTRKLTLIAPRILGVASNEAEEERENSQKEFVKVGDIFETVGISKPNYDLKFDKIVMTPRGSLSIFHPDKAVPSKKLQDLLSVRVEDYNENEEQLVDTMNALGEMKDSMGVRNMKDFFSKVKRNLKQVFPAEMTEPNYPEPMLNQKHEHENQASLTFRSPSSSYQNEYSGPVLGAINPIMFEKLFNQSFVTKSGYDTSDTVFPHRDMWKRDTKDSMEEVTTPMKFTEYMLKPFMGQIKTNDDVPQKYVLDLDEIEDEERNEDETQGWTNRSD